MWEPFGRRAGTYQQVTGGISQVHFSPSFVVSWRAGSASMRDYKAHLESLRNQAAECALIRDLATVRQKRELFTKLAAHLQTLAAEVERAMAAEKSHVASACADLSPIRADR